MSLDQIETLLDEISLEGLEGITVDSLWIRLKDCGYCLNVDDERTLSYIWSNIILDCANSHQIEFYLLPEPRPTIQLYNRYDFIHPETGCCRETSHIPPDVYGIVTPVSNGKVRGSCRHFETRVNITSSVLEKRPSLEQISSQYGKKFILVASQKLREYSLRIPFIDPNINLTLMEYCVLEKIGRCRKYGEITVGKEASKYRDPPKTLFYYRKVLIRRGLITKQRHILNLGDYGQSRLGLVLTLTRFHFISLTPLAKAAQNVSDILLTLPDNDCEYFKLRDLVGIKTRMFKHLFPQYLKNFSVYETICYKDGKKTADNIENGEKENDSESSKNDKNNENEDEIDVSEIKEDKDSVSKTSKKRKSKKEKKEVVIRRVKLIRPLNLTSESDDEEDPSNDFDDSSETLKRKSFGKLARLYNPRKLILDRSISSQVLEHIEKCQSADGLSLRELGEEFHLPKLEMRQLARLLERMKEIKSVIVDAGKQRMAKYFPINKVVVAEKKIVEESKSLKFNNATYNFLRRANIILDAVKTNKVIDQIFTLRNLIIKDEKDSPYMVDRKSIKTIIFRLAKHGYLRYIKTLLTCRGKEQIMEIVCDPSINVNDPLIREKIEERKKRMIEWTGLTEHEKKEKWKMKKAKLNVSKEATLRLQRFLAPLNETMNGFHKKEVEDESLNTEKENNEETVDKEKFNKIISKRKADENDLKKKKACVKASSPEEHKQVKMISEKKRKRKNTFDEVDEKAAKLMKRSRSSWTKEEDSFLLICRVASLIIDPSNPKFTCVPGSMVRDELHRYSPEVSMDKTARACMRRLRFMLKRPATRANIADWVAEIMPDIDALNIEKPNVPRSNVKVWSDAFIKLLHILLTKFQAYHLTVSSCIAPKEPHLFSSIEEIKSSHTIIEGDSNIEPYKPILHQEAKNIVDMAVNVVLTCMLSTLIFNVFPMNELRKYKKSLFQIYSHYPDALIRSVTTRLHKCGVMARFRKCKFVPTSVKKGVIPYSISRMYLYTLNTRFEMNDLVEPINKDIVIKNGITRSQAALVGCLMTSRKAIFDLTIPENFVRIDNEKWSSSRVRLYTANSTRSLDDSKGASRYILHTLRQELTVSSADPLQHVQDYLVINKCDVTCSAKLEGRNWSVFGDLIEIQEFVRPKEQPKEVIELQDLTNFIKSCGNLGANDEQLKSFKPNLKKQDLIMLMKKCLIFRTGVLCFKWVHWEHVERWLAHSVDDEDNEIDFIPRVWKNPIGKVEKNVLFKYMTSIFGKIMAKPCIKKETLLNECCFILPPVQTLEILEMLYEIGAIEKVKCQAPKKLTLFGKNNELSTLVHYKISPDGLLILKELNSYLQT